MLAQTAQQEIDFTSNELIPITYNRDFERLYQPLLPVYIFGTGSEGNSVLLKPYRLLIDLGLPFKRYKESDGNLFNKIDAIILTHIHGDHLNPATLANVLAQYPHIQCYMHPFMWKCIMERYPEKLQKFKHRIFEFNTEPIKIRNRDNVDIQCFPLTTKHGDILNVALRFYDYVNQKSWFYASDLDNLSTSPLTFVDCFGQKQVTTGLAENDTYDVMLLEANYDEEIIKKFLHSLDEKYIDLYGNVVDKTYYRQQYRAKTNMRHISEQEAFPFVQKHLKANGVFIPLHASKTFGTLWQE